MLNDDQEKLQENVQNREYDTSQESAQKYAITSDQLDVSVMGDNHGSVINYNGLNLTDVIQLIKAINPLEYDYNNASFILSSKNGHVDERKRQLADMLEQDLQDVVMDNEAALDFQAGTNDPATMPTTIDEWYYNKLDDYERAYVIVVALLNGETANTITRKAQNLWNDTVNRGQVAIENVPLRSVSQLRSRTYTLLQRGGDPRVFWQNPAFSLRMLQFIADESVEWSGVQPGQNFVDMLQSWVEELNGVSSRRAARMLGSIFAYQSTNQLIRVANNWATRKEVKYWRIAASLLNGAYEVGLSLQSESIKNVVWQLLGQWRDRWLQKENASVACAAAHAFGLIGRLSPTQGLQGLDSLLHLSQSTKDVKSSSNKNMFPRPLVSAIIQSYVSLSLAGHIRPVLSNLAVQVELLVHLYQRPKQVQYYLFYKRQRDAMLDVVFDAFFLIAATSLSAVSLAPTNVYDINETVPEEPSFPDSNSRDILLIGLLATSEIGWRNDLLTLLCAAIMEGKNKPAFDLLLQWMHIVLSQPQDRVNALYKQFAMFMIELGKMLSQWSSELKSRGLSRQSALPLYQRILVLWQEDQQVHGQHVLARYVLSQIGS